MQYTCYIDSSLPMFQHKQMGKYELLTVPWARKDSRFTLLFEHHLWNHLRLTANKKTVAEMFGLYPQRIETLYDQYTKAPFDFRVAGLACCAAMDEISSKGHNHITLFWDAQNRKYLLYIRKDRSNILQV